MINGIFLIPCGQVMVNKLHVEEVFPTSLVPEETKIGPDGAASLLGEFVNLDFQTFFGNEKSRNKAVKLEQVI